MTEPAAISAAVTSATSRHGAVHPFRRLSAAATVAATLLSSIAPGQALAQTAPAASSAAATPAATPAPAAKPASTGATPSVATTATTTTATPAAPASSGAATAPSAAPSASGTAPASGAPPDPIVGCVESYTEGQRLRNDGHLLEGRAEFWECSQAACPAALRKDCIAWSEEIRAQIPTVSFRVTLDGKIATEAKVYLDGRLLEKALDGRAVELNPGPHKASFQYGTMPEQEQDFVAAEGERYRIINAEFHSVVAATPGDTGATPGTPTAPGTVERPVPTLTYVFLGLGAVGAVSAAVWGISTSVTKSDLEATCSPKCSETKIDAVKQRALITDISMGVGVLGFAAAGITYFLRPEVPSSGSVEFEAVNVGNHGALGLVTVHTN